MPKPSRIWFVEHRVVGEWHPVQWYWLRRRAEDARRELNAEERRLGLIPLKRRVVAYGRLGVRRRGER